MKIGLYRENDKIRISGSIDPEYIGLDDGKISFRCSDRFDNIFLCGAYGVIDEDLCIKDWHNF